MKLFKGMMLGAAAVATATTAQAADLPVAPEPVDYVRICDAYGARFFYIPGTETCLRVGGRVRADYRFADFGGTGPNAWDSKTDESTRFRARGYIRLDSRTATEFGLLRTYVDTWFTEDNSGFGVSGIEMWEGFVQLGGFTFGRTGSFFDSWTGESWGSQLGAGLDSRANVLAYTAAFGNGMSASVSLESNTGERSSATYVDGYARGGHRIPALVAKLSVNQGWGLAALSGVVKNNRASTATVDSEIGWAVAAAARFNLPMLGSNTGLGLRAAYSDGAVGYLQEDWGVAGFDASLNGTATGLTNSTGWLLSAGLTHYWTSSVSTAVQAQYGQVDAFGINNDFDYWSAQGTLAWSPVSGLVIGTELEYENYDFDGTGVDNDNMTATFRVQRTF